MSGTVRLAGWGGWPARRCRVRAPRDEAALRAALAEAPVIARGAGRAYGDSALGTGLTLSTARLDRMLGFDADTGALDVEAGVVLGDIVAAFLPRGWLPPVMPGTRHVTVGGAIAADVHGKNHRAAGSFGRALRWIDLMGADGEVRRLSPGERGFEMAVGGMGLTGIVVRARLTLEPVESGWLRQETLAVPDHGAALATLEESGDWPYAIAWIDSLAQGPARDRALVYRGAHARAGELAGREPFPAPAGRRPAVPLTPPVSLVTVPAVRLMNARRYRDGRRQRSALVGWEPFFFPLDGIGAWNRLYGRRGFLQYQVVFPLARSDEGVDRLLAACHKAGLPPWLVTLKRFGPGGGGISFPMEGYSLAMDFPATPPVLALCDRLDRITLDHDGRFYLAKDARLPRAALEAADPRVEAFRAYRRETGADRRFASAQSERLGL